MIDLGSTDFYFRVSSMPRKEFEAYSSRLFDIWDAYVGRELSLEDYALSLEVEEGSVKGKGKILAGLLALYVGIGQYGSFVRGIQTIRGQVASAGDYLVKNAHSSLGSNQPDPAVKNRSGALGQLQRLFVKVQHNEITVEEAMEQASVIVGDDAAMAPEFMVQLKESLRNSPRYPEQIILPLEGFDEELSTQEKDNDQAPHLPKPKPEALPPPATQLRIEIWRESKRGRKRLRVVEL